MRREGILGIRRLCICMLLVIGLLTGCEAVPASGEPTSQVSQEVKTVLTVGDVSVTEPEAYVYLYLMQKPYEAYYGTGIWQAERSEGVTWGTWLLEEVQRQIVEIEILCQQAQKAGMSLTEDELETARQSAETAMAAIGETSAKTYGLTNDCLTEVYERSMLAGIYYQSVTDSYDLSLSEEEMAECEAISVCQIFIGEEDTSHLSEGQTQKQFAQELKERAEDGENFETLARAYSSENAQIKLTFDKEGYVFDTDAWLEDAFTKAAWELEAGDISPVIQTSYGYHVIKCTAVNSDALKQKAQAVLLNEKKKENFAAEYENWLAAVVCTEEAGWQDIQLMEGI